MLDVELTWVTVDDVSENSFKVSKLLERNFIL